MIPDWDVLPEELWPLDAFTSYILQELGLADEPTKQQLGILEWSDTGPQFSITVGFRGVAKSTLAAITGLRRLRIDPFWEKVLICSNTDEKAVEITGFMLHCIETVDVLRCLSPHDTNRSADGAFDVGPAMRDQAPSVRASGILSSALTGKRATLIVPDDIETLNNSITPLKQERLFHAVSELESIIKPPERDWDAANPPTFDMAGQVRQVFPRKIEYKGTPHLESSLYLRLVRERNYAIRYWPARYPDPSKPAEWEAYEGALDPLIAEEVTRHPELVGAPTDPERFDHEELLGRQSRMSRTNWQLQWMLNCRISTADRYPIRLGDLVVLNLNGNALPELVVWSGDPASRYSDLACVGMGADRYYHKPSVLGSWVPKEDRWNCGLFIDPAGRGEDELAWNVLAELNGNIFLLDEGGTTAGYGDDVLTMLANKAKHWQVNTVKAETNLGDGMFTALLQPVMNRIYRITVEEERVSQQKERRIVDLLAPLIQQHRLIVSREVLVRSYAEAEQDPEYGHLKSLPFQLSRITIEKGSLEWDDRADGLSFGVKHFLDAVAKDQQDEERRRREQEEDDLLELFLSDDASAIETLAMGGRKLRSGASAQGGVTREPERRRAEPVRQLSSATYWKQPQA
jgi:hypothetical protein